MRKLIYIVLLFALVNITKIYSQGYYVEVNFGGSTGFYSYYAFDLKNKVIHIISLKPLSLNVYGRIDIICESVSRISSTIYRFYPTAYRDNCEDYGDNFDDSTCVEYYELNMDSEYVLVVEKLGVRNNFSVITEQSLFVTQANGDKCIEVTEDWLKSHF